MIHSFLKRCIFQSITLTTMVDRLHQNNRKLTKFSPHTLLMSYVTPLGDMIYVLAVVQFVPNILQHYLVNGHYCIVYEFP